MASLQGRSEILLLFFAFLFPPTLAVRWLAVGKTETYEWNSTASCTFGRKNFGLVKKQTRLCRRYTEMMPHIVKASKVAAATCKDLFMDQRWNCSAIETAPQLSPDLTLGTREQAFVHALASAAVAYSVSKACASGTVFYCTCGRVPSEPPNGSFQWGGCGDNLKYGLKLSQTFVDAPDRVKRVRRSLTALTNRHNNRAGRKALRESQVTECKCHGVSGSCNIRTCWKALARLDVIGRRLKKKYATAMEVTGQGPASTDRRLRLLPVSPIRGLYNEEDLIYVTKSPDYCLPDPRMGSLGTRGRRCNATSSGTDGCKSMCCGRGYTTYTIEKIERCQCKYFWCCYVKCKMCKTWIDVQECN